ncbi:hypothetical protein HMPREF9718_02474 [Sphingobium yanoikuyae ATCC 51230]|uniref:Uncharacterized protein n=1 Tax=Sphingobium yanoikuyae ATCC 51230 TaxID=883163 RepID=K9CVN1_SPHYA|nr:hypothetical protein HMPREF9718_02474 [Sphingobium yanoikuyae ATCC 51230]
MPNRLAQRFASPAECRDLREPRALGDAGVGADAIGQGMIDKRDHELVARVKPLSGPEVAIKAETGDLPDMVAGRDRTSAQMREDVREDMGPVCLQQPC